MCNGTQYHGLYVETDMLDCIEDSVMKQVCSSITNGHSRPGTRSRVGNKVLNSIIDVEFPIALCIDGAIEESISKEFK